MEYMTAGEHGGEESSILAARFGVFFMQLSIEYLETKDDQAPLMYIEELLRSRMKPHYTHAAIHGKLVEELISLISV